MADRGHPSTLRLSIAIGLLAAGVMTILLPMTRLLVTDQVTWPRAVTVGPVVFAAIVGSVVALAVTANERGA